MTLQTFAISFTVVSLLIVVRLWWVAYALHRVRHFIESLSRSDEYLSAVLWFNRIPVLPLLFKFWIPPGRLLDEPWRSRYYKWRALRGIRKS